MSGIHKALASLLLIVAVCCGAAFAHRAKVMREAEYSRVFNAVAQHPAVTQAIGTPVEQAEWLPRRHTPQQNWRDSRVVLQGPNGRGELRILTTWVGGEEITNKVSFTPEGAETLNLEDLTTIGNFHR